MFIGSKVFSSSAVVLITLSILVGSDAKNGIKKTTKPPFKLPRYDDVNRRLSTNADTEKSNTNNWNFKEYLNKFRPVNVWEKLYLKRKAQGLNISIEKDLYDLIEGMDETDEILGIKLNSTVSGRRSKFLPPGRIDYGHDHDYYTVRRRLYELILHTMYWTRNKMTVMQTFRKKYQSSKIYKMGFMMCKNDIACKMFHRFAFRALSTCMRTYWDEQNRYYPIETLHAEERLMNKWMDITLLTDLIERNDISCREMLPAVSKNREQAWVFYD